MQVLGDVDLTAVPLTFEDPLPAETTRWWLMGHMGGVPVYTSVQSLAGVDLYAEPPYDQATPLDWDIASNLDGYATGGTFSPDWWAQVLNQHDVHAAPNESAAELWRFDTAGVSLGTVTVDLHHVP